MTAHTGTKNVASVTASESVIFAGHASPSQQMHGAAGAKNAIGWDADSINNNKITSHVDGNSAITITNSGELSLHCAVVGKDSPINNRSTYGLNIIHTPLVGSVTTYRFGSMYVRDDAEQYDSGRVHANMRLFVVAGDQIQVEVEVLDVQTATGDWFADETETELRLAKIDYR